MNGSGKGGWLASAATYAKIQCNNQNSIRQRHRNSCHHLRQQQLSIASGTWRHPRRMRNVRTEKIYRQLTSTQNFKKLHFFQPPENN